MLTRDEAELMPEDIKKRRGEDRKSQSESIGERNVRKEKGSNFLDPAIRLKAIDLSLFKAGGGEV